MGFKFAPFQAIICDMAWELCELSSFILMRCMKRSLQREYFMPDKETNTPWFEVIQKPLFGCTDGCEEIFKKRTCCLLGGLESLKNVA